MTALGDEADPQRQPDAPRPPQDHLLLWVVLMLGILVASIWWLLNQPWAGGSSGVMERTVVIARAAPGPAPAEIAAPAPAATDATPPDAASPPAADAPVETAAAPTGTDKASTKRGPRKPPASKKAVATSKRPVRTSPHVTRNARPLPGNAPPQYPLRALRSGIEGTVLVRVEIDAQGKPTQVDLEHRSGNRDLDRAALSAVRGWRFQPALRDGKPAASAVQVPVDFVLGEDP